MVYKVTEDIRGEFPQGYVADMITDKNGQIIGVPGYSGAAVLLSAPPQPASKEPVKAAESKILTSFFFIPFPPCVPDGHPSPCFQFKGNKKKKQRA